MSLTPIQSVSPLRLVQPAQPVHAPAPQPPDHPTTKSPKLTDSYSFEAIYRANLPKTMLTDAHRKLERIRDLVAGRTPVPIHFDPAPAPNSANPYARAYLQFPAPSAAQLNESATEQHVG